MYRFKFVVFDVTEDGRKPDPLAAFDSGHDAFVWCEAGALDYEIEFSGRVFTFDQAKRGASDDGMAYWSEFLAWISPKPIRRGR